MNLKINGFKVFFTSMGEGKNLLVLPGWAHDHNVWLNFQNTLSREMKITVIDYPGFGDSQLNPKIKSLDDYARFTEKVFAELNLKDVTVLGHSFGGSVALKMLSLNPKLPVKKLILVDSSGIRRFHPKKLLGMILAKSGKMAFSLPLLKKWHEPMKKILYKRLGETDYLNAGPLKTVFTRIVNENLEGILDKITVPTFIIWGRKDNITPMSLAKVLNQKIKNSQLEIVENAGHFPFLDRPEEFNLLVKKILKEN